MQLPGELHHLFSADSAGLEDGPANQAADALCLLTQETCNRASASGTPPHEITLKVGAIAVILRNLAPDMEVVNGTRVLIEDIQRNIVHVRM